MLDVLSISRPPNAQRWSRATRTGEQEPLSGFHGGDRGPVRLHLDPVSVRYVGEKIGETFGLWRAKKVLRAA